MSALANADTPFDDHLGPPVQFNGAFFGQNPDISLDDAKGEKKYQGVRRDKGNSPAHDDVHSTVRALT